MSTETNTQAKETKLSGEKLVQLRQLWAFVQRYPGKLIAAAISLLFASLATLAIPLALGRVIDTGFFANTTGKIDAYFLVLLGLAGCLGIFTALRFYFVTWLGERVVADIRIAVHHHLLTLSPEFFEDNRPSEISSRLTADTTLIQAVVGSSASVALRNLITGLGGIAVLIYLSPKLTGLMAIVIPLVVIPIIVLGRRVRALSRSSQDRIADIGAMADEVLGALRIVQGFTQEPRENERFTQTVEAAFNVAKARVFMRALMTAIVIIFIFGAVVLVLWQGALSVVEGRISGGTIASFVFVSGLVAGALGALSEVYGEVMRAAGAAGRLSQLMHVVPRIAPPAAPQPFAEPPLGSLGFYDVSFYYPSKPDRPVLDHVSFEILPGETVAVVGPSGAGKTTLFQLIQRFYDVSSGEILCDGLDIREVEPSSLRARTALVPQESTLFAATAYENILYGRPDASEAQVWAAAEAAAADDFLKALPDGIHSFLGEAGVRLSGGQRQRIAIARAILRDAPILLLDEATSALDAQSERLVQSALDRLMQGRTTLVIAHRLSTVLSADRILVFDQGRLVDQGTHQELLASDGLYASLAELQFNQDAAE
ncbi:MAG: ABC transporter transmembrane domain-containing protein [Pseudomonadota bacterium]